MQAEASDSLSKS